MLLASTFSGSNCKPYQHFESQTIFMFNQNYKKILRFIAQNRYTTIEILQ